MSGESRPGAHGKAVLEARGVHAFYGKSHILHGVSLRLDQGEIVTVLGRNGAGKTTTMRSLMGLTAVREGSVHMLGQDTTRWPAYRIARLGVGYVPEGRKIFGNLTVLENLTVPEARPGPWTLDRVFKLFPRLGERRTQLGRQLSGGEQEMLSIARPLLLNPRIMLLDEPSQGLAPLVVQEVMQVVRAMRDEGLSVLLVEQNVPLSLGIADRAYILDDGKVVHSGTAAELAADHDLVEKLAGATAQH
jgi:branched-chain amino acid transport system ATP-binding protein